MLDLHFSCFKLSKVNLTLWRSIFHILKQLFWGDFDSEDGNFEDYNLADFDFSDFDFVDFYCKDTNIQFDRLFSDFDFTDFAVSGLIIETLNILKSMIQTYLTYQ